MYLFYTGTCSIVILNALGLTATTEHTSAYLKRGEFLFVSDNGVLQTSSCARIHSHTRGFQGLHEY